MKILIVEDDEDKREQLSSFIKEKLSENIVETRSFQSGKKALLTDSFNLIILDMSIPTFDKTSNEKGGRPQPFGGRELLYEMLRNEVNAKAIVVTQFDRFGKGEDEITLKELDQQLMNLFPNIYLGAVSYSIKYSNWTSDLLKIVSSNNII